MRLRIRTDLYVSIFKNVFDFIETIVNWGDQVIVYFGHFLFKTLIWIGENVRYLVSRYEKIWRMFPLNWPVASFLIAIIYFSFTAVTNF